MIDCTNPDIIARQNIAPNAGCEIDGTFYDVRNLVHLALLQADRIEALEAKLAKVVEIGNKMAKSIEGNYYITGVVKEWCATLAEIKGERHE